MSGSRQRRVEISGEGQTNTVWKYFVKEQNSVSAKCQLCMKVLKLSQRSRKGLFVHLKAKHCIDLSQPSPTATACSSVSSSLTSQIDIAEDNIGAGKKVKLTDYFTVENSMEEMISRMISKDGFTFNSFCTSLDLRRLFLKSGHQLPYSPNTIRSIVFKYSSKIMEQITSDIKSLQEENGKFSLTFDEWTSRRNRRYLNVNLFSGLKLFLNLGLVRIKGSFTAEQCVKYVEERLDEFGLNLTVDIVSVTTDGPSMMLKVGKLMPCYQQLCLAHGIQLGVIDVLYRKSSNQQVRNPRTVELDENEQIENFEGVEDSSGESCDEEESGFKVSSLTVSEEISISSTYSDLIAKVRTTVKMFKKSPTKNDLHLQKYIQEEFGKCMELILDSKTRWNSLVNMLERFHNLKICISKALIDIESDIQFTDQEWSSISELVGSLEPVRLAVEVICRRDATLVTAETTLRFMLKKLDSNCSSLSNSLAANLRQRILQRRTTVTGVLLYLQNPKQYQEDMKEQTDPTFDMPRRVIIRKEIKTLLERVLRNASHVTSATDIQGELDTENNQSLNSVTEVQDSPTTSSTLSLKEELEKQLRTEYTSLPSSSPGISSANIDNILRKEMASFENDGVRGKYLGLAYRYLLTIPPTSVEAERAFSAAGYLCNDIRANLRDDTLNRLCFLRSYFQEK